MGMHNFRELKIWQRSMDLAEIVYKLTEDFPKEEKFGLSSQLKRCVVSVPSNISEGAGRGEPINSSNIFLKCQWVPVTKFKHKWNFHTGLGILKKKFLIK